MIEILKQTAQRFTGKPVSKIVMLPASGSYRQYYRIYFEEDTIIGVFNKDIKENQAFFAYTEHFYDQNIPVPQILHIEPDLTVYFLQDLGDETLFSILNKERQGNVFSERLLALYHKAIIQLPRIQILGGKGLDYSKAYPRAAFDEQSMRWDLNYFKYYFLKLSKIEFDEALLERDFNTLITDLLQEKADYFLFRDFQSRNIMVQNENVYFIDYQGGRKGALPYDIASLLYDGKAAIPQALRDEFLGLYISEVQKHVSIDAEAFKQRYWHFVLIRILQAMGAYGFRGFYEGKTHFLQSIPFALENVSYLLNQNKITLNLPHLKELLFKISQSSYLRDLAQSKPRLKVVVTSFSYRKGIPEDVTENGGGFVFDCRALPNPGREEAYKHLTGKDEAVADYLLKQSEVHVFKTCVLALIDLSVQNYLSRQFTHLMVNFGCTGGQHRSVFFAETVAAYLKSKYPVEVELIHTNL